MVFLKTDDLEGNMDSFGKDKMIQNVLMPKITKIATQAGLDPAGFKPDGSRREHSDHHHAGRQHLYARI